jgi:hypothetical protein
MTVYTEFAARRFAWGLSQAIAVLGCAGGFWLALGLFGGTAHPLARPAVWGGASTAVIVGVAANLLGARVLRRRASGFSLAELRASDQRQDAKQQMLRFWIVNGAQMIAATIAVIVTQVSGRGDLMWPLIGLLVGLHFLPLATTFRVPAYWFTGIGVVVTAVGALLAQGSQGILIIGCGTAAVLWLTSAYLLLTAPAFVEAETRRPV